MSSPTATNTAQPLVDTDIPAGNAIIDSVDGDTVHLRPDLRDTQGHWFYWHVRVRQAAGRTLRFVFPNTACIGTRGPAVSFDAGATWRWLTNDIFPHADHFDVTLPGDAHDARLAMTIPYVPAHLDAFLATPPATLDAAAITRETLCTSNAGHDVPLLRIGNRDNPDARVLVTARHHACESMASFVLEGMLAAALADNALMQRVEIMFIPFVDYDGVVAGDQGKNRAPHDHNRDYAGESVHRETAAIRELVPSWSAGRLRVGFDLHCPWLRNNPTGEGQNEKVYQVGKQDPTHWAQQQRFGELLEANLTGPLPYRQSNDLPFGQDWNTGNNYGSFKSSTRWLAEQPGVELATTFEIPYANAQGAQVHIEPCRTLGRDILAALRAWVG